MTESKNRVLALLLVGLSAGFLSSSLGIGGGVVLVPMLSIFLGFDMKKAIGTSLATIIPTATVGVIFYWIWDINTGSNNLHLKIAVIVVVGAIIGSFAGAKLTKIIASHILKKLFATMLLIGGLKLLNIINFPTEQITQGGGWLLFATGLLTGLLSALLGIGGGTIIVPVLTLFFLADIHQAIPTSLLIIVPTSIAGTFFHKKMQHIDTKAIKSLIPPAAIGAILGALLKSRMPSEDLKVFFGVFLIIMAIKMTILGKKQQGRGSSPAVGT